MDDLTNIAENRYRITLYKDNKEAGYIQLVFYYDNITLPHIEYELKPEYRGLGIMSEQLPKYIEFCKNLEYKALVALVKEDNIASRKLLLKNKFAEITSKIAGVDTYILILKFNQR